MMTMDDILQLLASSDVGTRLSVAEDLNRRLQDRTAWVDPLPTDTKKRVFNSVAGLARESNVKLCVVGLTCLQTLVEQHADAFQTYMNATFDTVVAKFADVKVSLFLTVCRDAHRVPDHLCVRVCVLVVGQPAVRAKAVDALISVINALGLSTGFEKLAVRLIFRPASSTHKCVTSRPPVPAPPPPSSPISRTRVTTCASCRCGRCCGCRSSTART